MTLINKGTAYWQQLDREHQQVAEVGGVGGPQQLLVAQAGLLAERVDGLVEAELLELRDGQAAVLGLVEVAKLRPTALKLIESVNFDG